MFQPELRTANRALWKKRTRSATERLIVPTDTGTHDIPVIPSSGVIHTPQLLKLSDIGDPEVLRQAGVQCVVENRSVGANFQDHVLGGMLFDLTPVVLSLDALHGEEYAKA